MALIEGQPARNSCPPFAWFAMRTPIFMYIVCTVVLVQKPHPNALQDPCTVCTCTCTLFNLGYVIPVHPSFDAHPRPSLQRCCVLKHTQHISHLSDRHHQLLPLPNTQVPNVLDGLLDVLLFEGFDVYVALYAFFGNYTLDLERLRNEISICVRLSIYKAEFESNMLCMLYICALPV